MVFGGLNSHSGASVTGRFVSCKSKGGRQKQGGKKAFSGKEGEKWALRKASFQGFHTYLIDCLCRSCETRKGRHKSNTSLSICLHHFFFLLYLSTVTSINFPTNMSKRFHLLFSASMTSLFLISSCLGQYHVFWRGNASQKHILLFNYSEITQQSN